MVGGVRSAIRAYQPRDLGSILQLWEQAGCVPVGADGLTLDQAVELMGSTPLLALVAEQDGRLVGVALGGVTGPVGWIHRLTLADAVAGGRDLTQRLLQELEFRLVERGARKAVALARADDRTRAALEQRGYRAGQQIVRLERDLPAASATDNAALAELGAQLLAPGLWDELRGLDEAKEIIERRVILPLAEPELARRHSVAPPRAIVLFGPPGTGKTTFAKGIASRLAWPFVEIEVGSVGGHGPERAASLLAESFEHVRAHLASAVVFVDEVEDLASIRSGERKVTPSVTNEFLKQIPQLRELPEHLLVCATNWVSRLDHAFLRPGRFDYVLPVGPPDADARRAIWERYVDEITDEPLDVDILVAASELFTPADIEFAARKAAQRAFEREHFEGARHRARTDDFIAAIRGTRRTLSRQIVADFHDEVERFARF
jgi:transitional endoplasmic reticulum ATPase